MFSSTFILFTFIIYYFIESSKNIENEDPVEEVESVNMSGVKRKQVADGEPVKSQ